MNTCMGKGSVTKGSKEATDYFDITDFEVVWGNCVALRLRLSSYTR